MSAALRSVDSLFDDSVRPPGLHLLLLEWRALFEGAFSLLSYPLGVAQPRGDGHSVLVVPGFLAGDPATSLLRRFLSDRGYDAVPWGLGTNIRYDRDAVDRLSSKVRMLAAASGRSVSIVGWSLGGVLARNVALEEPQHIRQVITLGSPFTANFRASNARLLFELLNGHRMEELDLWLLAAAKQQLAVPSTAVYTKSDGIVNWRCCVHENPGPLETNVRVIGSHCGLPCNPLVIALLDEILARPQEALRLPSTPEFDLS